MNRSTLFVWTLAVLLGAVLGCASNNGPGTRDAGGGGFDAGPDEDAAMGDGGIPCTTDSECPDDGIFCNGTLSCVMGSCRASDIPTCNDGVGCTRDECDAASDMCQNIPQDSACPSGNVCIPGSGCGIAPACEFDTDCGDGVFCNGVEVCVGGMCMSPAEGVACDDSNSCTEDTCSEAMGACASTEYPDIATNPMHCGTGADDCVECPMPDASRHQIASCVAGACALDCEPGYGDADGDMTNGCECMGAGMVDLPELGFADTNCDGIDGDVGIGVFVAPTFVGGNDANPGTIDMPVATIARGIEIASTSGRTRMEVYVSAGTYMESVVLRNGVSIYGGYLATMGWARSTSFVSEIRGGETAVSGTGISRALEVQLFTIVAANASTPGASSYGVRLTNSTGVVRLSGNTIRAGDGAAGSDGGAGTPGTDGSRGRDGHNGQSNGSGFPCTNAPCNEGGASACALGGRGGNGGYDTSGGQPGATGTAGSLTGVAGTGGTGGAASLACLLLSEPGGNAPSPGGPGADGANASTPTVTVGTAMAGLYVPARGTDGTAGTHGGGGGGGG
ncbi:MAG: DUF1565 domain-containing protein, partial [Myxococcales bacterium]|nr:DUF1565 domain-containing protein [Myxococcales bacterium]